MFINIFVFQDLLFKSLLTYHNHNGKKVKSYEITDFKLRTWYNWQGLCGTKALGNKYLFRISIEQTILLCFRDKVLFPNCTKLFFCNFWNQQILPERDGGREMHLTCGKSQMAQNRKKTKTKKFFFFQKLSFSVDVTLPEIPIW